MWTLLALLACDTGPDYGPFTLMIRAHRKTLLQRPCDGKIANELAVALRDSFATEEALQVFRDFEAVCEPDGVMLTKHVDHARAAGKLDEALGAARKLRELLPDNAVYHRQLTDLLVEAGQPAEAVPLLQGRYYAIPKAHDTLESLAQAQEAAGLPCDALVSWGTLWWVSPDKRGVAGRAQARIDETGACPGVVVTQDGKVRQDPENGYWRFQSLIGGKEAWLGLDTSAPLTYMTADAFEGAQDPVLIAEGVTMKAGPGKWVGDLYRVQSARIGDVEMSLVDVLVLPKKPGGIDGFLGINTAGRVRMKEKDKRTWTLHAL